MTDSSQRSPPSLQADVPVANVKRRHWTAYLIWIVPLVAIAIVAYLLYGTWSEPETTIAIVFRDVSGVEAGKTAIRCRGVEVGNVRSVELREDLEHVVVRAVLRSSAVALAREGTEFWIVRPTISLSDIHGLQTVISGSYIRARAGGGGRRTEFVGCEEAPRPAPPEGLSLVLLSDSRGSIESGSPIEYRGVRVGEVVDAFLDHDARAVRVRIVIHPRYAPLVGRDSRFWIVEGLKVEAGIFMGAHVDLGPLPTLYRATIQFATPSAPDEPVPDGFAFRLHDGAEEEWIGWAPAIPLSPDGGGTADAEEEPER